MSGASCVDACSNAISYAKEKGETYAALVSVIEDCVALCALREEFQKRSSALLAQIKTLCGEACSRCASACESMDDENLANCIKDCRECSDNCK
jgi:hypothetical protein